MFSSSARRAEGRLVQTPVAHILLYGLEHHLCGTLIVQQGHGHEARILLEDGHMVAALLPGPERSLLAGLIPLCECVEGAWSFAEDENRVGDSRRVLRGHVDPFALVAAALRGPFREDVVDRVLEDLDEWMLAVDADVDLDRFGLTRIEWQVANALRKRSFTYRELLAERFAPPRVVRRLIYLLRVTKCISAVPQQRTSLVRALRRSSMQALQRPSMPVVAAPPIAPQRPLSVVPSLRPSDPPSRGPAAALRADSFFREAELLKHQRDLSGALLRALRAVELEPGEASYHALVGHLVFCNDRRPVKAAEVIVHLDRALRIDPQCHSAHYYRALALKRWGDDEGAEHHLRVTLSIKPSHRGARRALGLGGGGRFASGFATSAGAARRPP